VTKALLTLEESYDRGCNAGVEPHIANEHHLANDTADLPFLVRGNYKLPSLLVDGCGHYLLRLVGPRD